MKRIRYILVILVLLFTFGINVNKVEAAGKISLTTNKSSVYVGEEFTISVNLSGMSAATITVKINVDTSKVEYVSGPGNSNFVNGRVIYTWTDPNGGASPLTSGTIATFKFKSKQTGTVSFSVSGDFYDANEESINPSFSGTSVSIKEKVVQQPSTGGNNNSGTTGNTGGSAGGSTRRKLGSNTREWNYCRR